MKKFLSILLLTMSSLCFATKGGYLFFQSSSDAHIIKTIENHYTLTINDPSNFVTYFSDRPMRQSGLMKLSEFLALWSNKAIKNNFAVNPPNIAIDMVTDQGVRQHTIAIATHPVYKDGRLSYQLQVLKSKELEEGKLQHVALFFDGIHWNPGGF